MDVLRSVREKQNVLEEHLTKERLPGVNVSIGGTLTPGELHKQMETHFGNINDRVDVKLNTLEGICNTICRELSKCTDAILKLDQHRLELKHHNETLAEKVGVLERNSVIKDQTITKLETLVCAFSSRASTLGTNNTTRSFYPAVGFKKKFYRLF